MARVLSLRAGRFRSHEGLRLALDGRPVALFGPNGSGKTNVLEAVSLLSPGRGLRRAASEEMARRPGPVGWKVAAEVEGAEGSHAIETWGLPGAARQLTIDGKSSPQAALGRIAPMLWLVPAMDRLWIEGPEGRRRFLDRMTLSVFPDHAEASLAFDKAMRERNRLLRDQVRDAGWYGALEARMAEAGARIIAARAAALARVEAAQEAAATAFPSARLSLTGPEGSGAEAEDAEPERLAALLRRGRGADLAAGRSLAGPHRADLEAVWAAKEMPAAQCSTGEQKALLISLVLANARALAAEGRLPVLLLDEIAAHLDPARRGALYDEIADLGAQAWMTGTSRALFEGLGERAQLIGLREAEGASRIGE